VAAEQQSTTFVRAFSQNEPRFTETKPGVFEVGPIAFDKSGRWAVRLHFYEECVHSETSPHGRAAFFVDVPSTARRSENGCIGRQRRGHKRASRRPPGAASGAMAIEHQGTLLRRCGQS
jgi:hypothetical protein